MNNSKYYVRYTDQYTIQLACLPGPKKPKDLDSFLRPIVDELLDLSKHGLIVRKSGRELCRAKVHLLMASGDIPAVAEMMHHSGHTSVYGCRICKVKGRHPLNSTNGMYFVDINSMMRTKTQLKNGDPVRFFDYSVCKYSRYFSFAKLPKNPCLLNYLHFLESPSLEWMKCILSRME